MWPPAFLCECFSNIPSAAEVLRADQVHQVCTQTQCYESEADAFGVIASTRAATLPLWGVATLVLLAATLARPYLCK